MYSRPMTHRCSARAAGTKRRSPPRHVPDILNAFRVPMQADASGTMEAVKAALAALPQDSVVLRYLLAAPNDSTSSDVDLAAASGAIVLGFNVEPAEAVIADAKNRGESGCCAGLLCKAARACTSADSLPITNKTDSSPCGKTKGARICIVPVQCANHAW